MNTPEHGLPAMGNLKLINDYLAALPEARAQRGHMLHALVRKMFPDVAVSLEYRMPTYRLGANFFAWGNQKQYLSVYTCSGERIAAFRRKRPEVNVGVGCIKFRDKDVFAIAELREVVKNALAPGKALLAREAAALAKAKRSSKP